MESLFRLVPSGNRRVKVAAFPTKDENGESSVVSHQESVIALLTKDENGESVQVSPIRNQTLIS